MSGSNRKRKMDVDDKQLSAKKPKLDSMYTRTDPVTGELGRVRKKDDKYWRDFTRRAAHKKAKREAAKLLQLKDDAQKRKEREIRRKKREEKKQDQNESKEEVAVISDSESVSSEEEEVKRDDPSKFVPFHALTQRFKDHVCVITGGGRGIGQACALRLAQEGAIIYILDYMRFKETESKVVEAQRAIHERQYREALSKYYTAKAEKKSGVSKPRKAKLKPKCFWKKCNVTVNKEVVQAINEIVEERGYIDVVLNFVNVTGKEYAKTASAAVTAHDFARVMEFNLNSVVNVCNAVIPFMKKESYGRIVNLASKDGKEGKPKGLAFAAAKSAVINVTKTYGQEYAGTGITINCVAPHFDEYHVSKLGNKEEASKVPMGRPIDLEELSGAVAFIASEENTYTTGFCYDLSGGTNTY